MSAFGVNRDIGSETQNAQRPRPRRRQFPLEYAARPEYTKVVHEQLYPTSNRIRGVSRWRRFLDVILGLRGRRLHSCELFLGCNDAGSLLDVHLVLDSTMRYMSAPNNQRTIWMVLSVSILEPLSRMQARAFREKSEPPNASERLGPLSASERTSIELHPLSFHDRDNDQ